MVSFKFKKIFGLSKVSKNNSGIIIYVVLWVVVILTSLAVSLGRNTQMGLSLTKHNIGKVRSENLAWGAVSYVVDLMSATQKDEAAIEVDTLYYCGVSAGLKKTPIELFENYKFQDGYFNISYLNEDGTQILGLQDEERFINVNTFGLEQQDIVVQLLVSFGVEEKLAESVAASIIDYRDTDSVVSGDNLGAEDDFYLQLEVPYHCKNRPFDSKEELLLVKGMTPEIFNKIKDYVTVFPKEGIFQVNLNTASKVVLKSVARSYSGAETNTQAYDADSLVDKIISYRQGPDQKPATEDDQSVDIVKINLNEKENAIAVAVNSMGILKSSYLRAKIKGTDELSNISSQIEAVIDLNNLNIVSWAHK